MSDRPRRTDRRRVLGLLGSVALPLGLAGCSGDGGDTSGQTGTGTTETFTDRQSDAGAVPGDQTTETDERTDRSTETATAEPTATDEPSATDGSTATAEATGTTEPTTSASGSDGAVTVDVGLLVRESRPGFDNFETFRTGFEGLSMQTAGGEGVQVVSSDASSGFDLATVSPGERQQLTETTIPPGDYEQAAILLPVQSAALTDGSDPEFARMVPATGELGTSGALTLEAGDVIEFTATLAVLRVAGDGPWTYTVGFGTFWQTEG